MNVIDQQLPEGLISFSTRQTVYTLQVEAKVSIDCVGEPKGNTRLFWDELHTFPKFFDIMVS